MAKITQPIFSCRDVRVYVDDKEIVKGVDLDVFAGEKHVLMGPNGSGKSTFAAAIMGHPDFRLEGEVYLQGESIVDLPTEEKARRGLFLGFQHPVAVPGVAVANFLKAALTAKRGEQIPVREFRNTLYDAFDRLHIEHEFAGRYLNDGFSGGEKKRLEILQMLLLEPRFALLDEIDSGLDIDALKLVASGIRQACTKEVGLLMVTHYQRILDHIEPAYVHVFIDGKIVRSGGPEQARLLEQSGYDGLTEHYAEA